MSKFVLTRYLYIFDEVAISFVSCLLKKKSLQECYYWLSGVVLFWIYRTVMEFTLVCIL